MSKVLFCLVSETRSICLGEVQWLPHSLFFEREAWLGGRASARGAMGRHGGPIELFLLPVNALRLV